jgi:sulfide:quinone oxidoreductase
MHRAGGSSTMSEVTSTAPIAPRRIVIVGGGVAGLEAALALHDLAETRVSVTVIAPEPVFTPRALDLARPFTGGQAAHLDLERFMSEHGGRFRRTVVLGVDAEQRILSCTTGPDERYDTLVIAVGASARPAYEHALTFGADFPACDELLADLVHGGPNSVAFVVPRDCTWPLPLYELALMTADEARLTNSDEMRVHLVTPEQRALDLFGARASAAVTEVLQAAHIRLHCGIDADVHRGGRVGMGPEGTLAVDRVVALAHLAGPSLAGLPADAHGFIPVDEYGRVTGVDAVYAAGDVTDHPIKHGGLASQQADAVAAHVAAAAGAPVEAVPYSPVLSGRLLTGLRATRPALWYPPATVSGRYLAPYLEAHGLVALPLRQSARGDGVDVRLPLSWFKRSVERREVLRDLPAAGA